jgi:hypothetical protein
MGGNINLDTRTIINCADPTLDHHVVNKRYADANSAPASYWWQANFGIVSANNNGQVSIPWDTSTVEKTGSGWVDTVSPYTTIGMPVTGRYMFTAIVWFSNNNNGYRAVWIKNNTTNERITFDTRVTVPGLHDYINITGTVNALAGQTFTVQVTQNSGGNLSVGHFEHGSLSITKIGNLSS